MSTAFLLRPLPSVQWFVGDVVFGLISLILVQNSLNGYCALPHLNVSLVYVPQCPLPLDLSTEDEDGP